MVKMSVFLLLSIKQNAFSLSLIKTLITHNQRPRTVFFSYLFLYFFLFLVFKKNRAWTLSYDVCLYVLQLLKEGKHRGFLSDVICKWFTSEVICKWFPSDLLCKWLPSDLICKWFLLDLICTWLANNLICR